MLGCSLAPSLFIPFVLNVKINFDYSVKDSHYDNLPWEHGVLF